MNTHNPTVLEKFGNLLVIDIETVAATKSLEDLSIGLQQQWYKKSAYMLSHTKDAENEAQLYEKRAGIYAEFGKIVCIGLGIFEKITDNQYQLRMKYIVDTDEKVILQSFLTILESYTQKQKNIQFCGHNIKEFDIPYICRRLLINQIELPNILQLSGKKPWEINHFDTLELWRFGDYKHYTSLDLLAQIFQIPSPKSDINGSEVNNTYWIEEDLTRIGKYCLQDVYTTAQIFLKISGCNDTLLDPYYIDKS